jgi:hypothetical protein
VAAVTLSLDVSVMPRAAKRGRSAPREWLRRLAEPHEPRAHPYYLHVPRDARQPAPGWYWVPADAEHPVYLGASAFDAERKLRELDL